MCHFCQLVEIVRHASEHTEVSRLCLRWRQGGFSIQGRVSDIFGHVFVCLLTPVHQNLIVFLGELDRDGL